MNVKEKMCECLLKQIDCLIIQSDLEKRLFILHEKSDVYGEYFTLVQLHSDDAVPMYGFDVDSADSYYPVQICATRLYDDINYAYRAIVNCPAWRTK